MPIAEYIADFLCVELKLIIELDGGQHVDQMKRDLVRTQKLEALGYRVVRYWNDEVLLRISGVLEDLLRKLGRKIGRVVQGLARSRSRAPLLNPPLRCAQGRRH